MCRKIYRLIASAAQTEVSRLGFSVEMNSASGLEAVAEPLSLGLRFDLRRGRRPSIL